MRYPKLEIAALTDSTLFHLWIEKGEKKGVETRNLPHVMQYVFLQVFTSVRQHIKTLREEILHWQHWAQCLNVLYINPISCTQTWNLVIQRRACLQVPSTVKGFLLRLM